MELLTQKKELIDWISTLDNPLILNKIYNIKNKSKLSFEERCSKALTLEEFRTEIKKRIRNYPVKKMIYFENEVVDYLNNLVFELYDNEYFGFIDSSEAFADKLIDFLFENITTFPARKHLIN